MLGLSPIWGLSFQELVENTAGLTTLFFGRFATGFKQIAEYLTKPALRPTSSLTPLSPLLLPPALG